MNFNNMSRSSQRASGTPSPRTSRTSSPHGTPRPQGESNEAAPGSSWRAAEASSLQSLLHKKYSDPESRCKALDEIERMVKPSDMQKFYEWAVKHEELNFFDGVAGLFDEKPKIIVQANTLEEAAAGLCDNISVEVSGYPPSSEPVVSLSLVMETVFNDGMHPDIEKLFRVHGPMQEDTHFPTAEEQQVQQRKDDIKETFRQIVHAQQRVAIAEGVLVSGELSFVDIYEQEKQKLDAAIAALKKLLDEGVSNAGNTAVPPVEAREVVQPPEAEGAIPQETDASVVAAEHRVKLAGFAVGVIELLLTGNPDDNTPYLRQLVLAKRELQAAREHLASLTRPAAT